MEIIMTKRLLLFISFFTIFQQTLTALDGTRALWVTRWDYESIGDIERIMQTASDLGFNTVLFQVRGNGTVTYQSEIEVQSEKFRLKGWDPLQIAIESAHALDVQLHAWVNVFPGWSGDSLPTHEEQLYLLHPGWFMLDIFRQPRRLDNGYLFLTPTHPHVREYLKQLCSELYTQYDIDGLHFDYIRFPASVYSYDQVSVALFKRAYGVDPQKKPIAWRLWRINSITEFVDEVYRDVKFQKPRLIVSAAVISDRFRARNTYFQDGTDWLARGIIDALYPMLYSDLDAVFQRELEDYVLNSHGRHIYPGIHVKKDGIARKLGIIDELDVPGLGIFSYKDLMENSIIKDAFKSAVDTLWAANATPARMPWKVFTKDNVGPTFSQIQTIPSPLTPFTPFKIAAKINDPSGVYDDLTGEDGQGIYTEYGTEWPPGEAAPVTLSKIDKTEDWYITDEQLPGLAAGAILYARLYAHDNYHEGLNRPRRNRGESNVEQIPVVNPQSSFSYKGNIGPMLWRPGILAVDAKHQIWVTTDKNGPVIVFDSTGKELDFSPIRFGMNGDYESIAVTGVVGFAQDAYDNRLIACNTNPPTIFRYNIQDGEALPGTHINFDSGKPDTIRALSTDSLGNMYILQKNTARWFILTATGDFMTGMPYGNQQKAASDIAVLHNGAVVLVTDRTANVVQRWHGATESDQSQYWRAEDFLDSASGLGDICVSHDDHFYLCNSRYDYIAKYNRVGDIVEHIVGKNLNLFSPKAMAFSPDYKKLYVTQVVGDGPDKVKVWQKNQ